MSLFNTLSSIVPSKRFGQLFAAAAAVFIGSGANAVVTTLSHNEQVNNLSGGAGAEKHFKIFVPASKAQVMFLMSGGSGDADMYIRKGSQPNTISWSYRPYLTTTTEKVVVNNPSADGDWYYIMIKGYSSFSGVDFVAQFQAGPRLFRNGGSVRNIAGTYKEQRHFKIEVPLNATKLTIKTSAGSGDVDVYARFGSIPTSSYYSYSSAHDGNNESIVVSNPLSGTWYFMLRGVDNGYSGVKLFAEVDGRAKFRMSSVAVKDQRPGLSFTSLPNYSWRYGNWGGPFWMNAKEQSRSVWNGSTTAFTVDAMDELFKTHDLAVKNAANDATVQQAEQALEDGLIDLPNGANGVNHSFWGQIYVSNGSDVPANVMLYPGSPYALPQVLMAPKLMPFSEYARRQALIGLNAGWLTE